MVAKLGYDSFMKRLLSATVAVLALVLVPALGAQVNGISPSVTSIGFGGHFGSFGGIPPSVTSIGPLGIVPNPVFNNQPCCLNPLFPVNPNPPVFVHHHRRHHDFDFGTPVALYPVPYAVPYPVAVDDSESDQPEQYQGGPTIFDRRGNGTPYPQPEPQEQASAAPASTADETVADQPKTVLVFKDGHQAEVDNYAIVGDTLYDLSGGGRHKIPLSALDLTATAQQNDDRGIDFTVPAN